MGSPFLPHPVTPVKSTRPRTNGRNIGDRENDITPSCPMDTGLRNGTPRDRTAIRDSIPIAYSLGGIPVMNEFGPWKGANFWSGRSGSNRRRSAWEADILPLNYARDATYASRKGDGESRASMGMSGRIRKTIKGFLVIAEAVGVCEAFAPLLEDDHAPISGTGFYAY